MIHPAVRIVLLCVFVACVVTAGLHQLLAGAGLLAAAYWYSGAPLRPAMTMLRRLRWFLVSILLVFLWFTPGESPLWLRSFGEWAPTLEGAQGGLRRIAALAMIVGAVNLLLQLTRREQLLGAIYWLVGPFQGAGATMGERLAVRATLVLDKVTSMQQRVLVQRAQLSGQGRAMAQARDLAVDLVQNVLDTAESEQLQTLVIDRPIAPSLSQWLLPVMLILLMVMI